MRAAVHGGPLALVAAILLTLPIEDRESTKICLRSARRLNRRLSAVQRAMPLRPPNDRKVRHETLAQIVPAFEDSIRLADGLLKRGLLDEFRYRSALDTAYANQIRNVTTEWYLGVVHGAIRTSPRIEELLQYLWHGHEGHIQALITQLSN